MRYPKFSCKRSHQYFWGPKGSEDKQVLETLVWEFRPLQHKPPCLLIFYCPWLSTKINPLVRKLPWYRRDLRNYKTRDSGKRNSWVRRVISELCLLFLFSRPAPLIRSILSVTGLTMLLPYIISNRSKWISCKLRVFALLNCQHESEVEERKWVSRFVERIYTMSYISAM